MNQKEFEMKLAGLPATEPDADDQRAMRMLDASDDESIELDEFKALLDYSGKLSLRIPRSLHRELAEQAKREGVSLNQYALYKLTHTSTSPSL